MSRTVNDCERVFALETQHHRHVARGQATEGTRRRWNMNWHKARVPSVATSCEGARIVCSPPCHEKKRRVASIGAERCPPFNKLCVEPYSFPACTAVCTKLISSSKASRCTCSPSHTTALTTSPASCSTCEDSVALDSVSC